MGQKNHELVPTPLICRIAGLKSGGAFKVINSLHKNKLLFHQSEQYDGYRLTYMGYDYLALKAFVSRGVVAGLGRKIGVGKVDSCSLLTFADIY
jgi:RIO kinase 2